ncbi:VWD domain-containing protein [Catellatospora sichuanensis]|uniref:VWD domain-containing protein n=1 Tax=Catellatospora sichuanensis TaxID=1969805 RepID=UPI001181EC2E|nr:VWD domain-containing protein [Catellatospora sichuanensis]
MAHPLRRALLTAAAFVCALLPATPARAAGDLAVTVRGDDPLATVLVLANRGDAPCQLVTSTYGTLAVTRLEQDGVAVTPLPMETSFEESLETVLAKRLHTLEPGASTEVPLRAIPIGPTGHAIEIVTWSAGAGAFGSLYPVKPGSPLRLEFTYAVPIVPAGGPAACAPLAGAGVAAEADDTSRPWWHWAVLAGVGVILTLVAVALLLAPNRRKRRQAGDGDGPAADGSVSDGRSGSAGPGGVAGIGGAVVLALAVALGAAAVPGRPAYAEIIVTDRGLDEAWAACSAILRGPGGDPAGILPALDAPGVTVSIIRAQPGDTHEGALDRNNILIFWDPKDRHAYHGTGGNADPCDALYHEFHHGWQHNQGKYSREDCAGSGIPTTEVLATRAQNRLREALGRPARSHYGERPLPSGDCTAPPPPPACTGAGCGHSTGDPHLRTVDGLRYDFQAAGEFIAVRDTAGAYEIQVRQEPVPGSRIVAVNSAVAAKVDGDRVEARMTTAGVELLVAGVPTGPAPAEPASPRRLPGGGELRTAAGGDVELRWKDGSRLVIEPIGIWGLALSVEPAQAHAGKLEGLLGDFNGKSDDDVRPRGGQPLGTQPTFAALYPAYADSWRIDAASSLFTYPEGRSTDSYVDRAFPEQDAATADLPNRASAEAICRGLGVSDPAVLAGCVLDVALTGQPDFAVAAKAGQVFAGGAELGGQTWTVRVDTPEAVAKVDFAGTKGQKVFLDVPATTLPNQCGGLDLLGPDGKQVATGCVINGSGYIDGTVLPETGTYSIAVDPSGDSTGEARLRLLTVEDQQEAIGLDGPELTARLAKPGAVARFTFAATAGQKVFVDVPATNLPNQCGGLDLLGPDGKQVTTGCVINGSGYIDGFTLPGTGSYTVVVDPRDRSTGEAKVRVTRAVDQRLELSVNGEAVTARIDRPGAVSVLTFTGRTGQRVFIEVPSTDLPSQCGGLELRGPDGDVVESGCVINGKGGLREEGTELPSTGTYQLIVDPQERATGTAQVRLRT